MSNSPAIPPAEVLGAGVGESDIEGLFRDGIPEWAADWEVDDLVRGMREPGTTVATALDVVADAIGEADVARRSANRAMARMVGALREALDVAGRNPHVYLTGEGLAARDARELAERAAATDAALQLHLTPATVRAYAHVGTVLDGKLPTLWAQFRAGMIGYAQANAAVENLTGIDDPALIERYDTTLADNAHCALTPGAFRQRARTLADSLRAEPPAARHARDFSERRVGVEPVENGMAWLHAFVSAEDATRIKTRLDATAKRIAKSKGGDPRLRDQIRADLFTAWLAGDGTPTAAKVRPILLIPALGLLGKSGQPSVLQGYGPIDPVTAAQLFSDAPSFQRALSDPFSGEILDFDRTRYRPTQAQRIKLAVVYGTCGREGCERLAVTSDIDHVDEWHRDDGPTNEDNLIPLCPPDHRLKTLTKIRYVRADDGSVIVTTPTGYIGRNAPPSPLPDDPPF